jgi:hypothetical protein
MSRSPGTCPLPQFESPIPCSPAVKKKPSWKTYYAHRKGVCAMNGCVTSSNDKCYKILPGYKYPHYNDGENYYVCNGCHVEHYDGHTPGPERTPSKSIRAKRIRKSQVKDSEVLNHRTRSKQPNSNATQKPTDQPEGYFSEDATCFNWW